MMNIDFPLMVYDGDCGFCKKWIRKWHQLTGTSVSYCSFQEIPQKVNLPVTEEQFKKAVYFFDSETDYFSGAGAVFKSLTYAKGYRWLFPLYKKFKWMQWLSELLYRCVAKNRYFFSKITRLFATLNENQSTFFIGRHYFFKGFGCVLFLAFLTILFQIKALVGVEGALPAVHFFAKIKAIYPTNYFYKVPSLFWINASDIVLVGMAMFSCVLSLAMFFGFYNRIFILSLGVIYFSYISIGDVFFRFQWDILVIELCFLSLFFAPTWIKKPTIYSSFSFTGKLLLTLCLFKLIFMSGVVKLQSGDISWKNFTALNYHYFTQPLPHWGGWFMHQLPKSFQKLSVLLTFVVELGMPFLLFFGTKLRRISLLSIVTLMFFIMFTGNYGFFNLLVIVLCLALVDDEIYEKLVSKFSTQKTKVTPKSSKILVLSVLIISILMISNEVSRLYKKNSLAKFISKPLMVFRQHFLINGYGLFAVMTTRRVELEIQGSMDGKNWEVYQFHWKPQSTNKAPKWVFPHQPRFDWQMWFASLSQYNQNPWLISILKGILEDKKGVKSLFSKIPQAFETTSPKYIKVVGYEYSFTNIPTLWNTGEWWDRKYLGEYSPVFNLK